MDHGHTRHEREERSGYAIPRACSLVFRKCLFPCLRRIPRFTKRRAALLLALIWLCWVVAACTEWRAEHNQHNTRKQLVKFLQETRFYVVEEGHNLGGFQSPTQRKLASTDTDPPKNIRRSAATSEGQQGAFEDEEPVEVEPSERWQNSAEHHLFAQALSIPKEDVQRWGHRRLERGFAPTHGEIGFQVEYHDRRAGTAGRKRRASSHEGNVDPSSDTQDQSACPLIYTADAHTAKEHGLQLFQEELDLLGTIAARLCKCLCIFPTNEDRVEQPQGRSLRSSVSRGNANGHGRTLEEFSPLPLFQSGDSTTPAQEWAAYGQTVDGFGTDGRDARRKLGVCKGEVHTRMLEEMLKGANVVVAGDSGWFYRWFGGMRDAYYRTCSHFSTRATVGIPEGTVLRTLLTGTDMYEDSWFQLEGAPWRPLRHPVDAVRHAFNYVQYKITRAQVGPLGKSAHTDMQPLMVTFDGCTSIKGEEGSSRHGEGRRLLVVPKLSPTRT